MSLALPLFADLSRANDVLLRGDTSGNGAFSTGSVALKTQSVTAGGLVVNASSSLLPGRGAAVPSLSLTTTPRKGLLAMGILDSTGSLTGSVTASDLFNQPGLQATLTAMPPAAINKAAALPPSASITLDYLHPSARLRAVLSPSDPANLVRSLARPVAQLSGVTAVGPCVLGARVGVDASSTGSPLTSWSMGANFTRMTADDGPGGVERLSGQQWAVVVNDTSAAGGTRAATASVHQLVSGGRVELGAEYTISLNTPGASALAYLTLGVSRRLESGGLVKARLQHTGQLALRYQQALAGVGQAAISCSLDPLHMGKVAPAFGLSLTV